ncbi:MAG: hypothetical protein KDC38_16585, partial [Planctomycetes bacterium]|nr:hypothetical protein [Planctomycetota bacterium]
KVTVPIAPGGSAQTVPYGAEQPMVYASTWVRPDLEGFCVVLLNWTHGSDTNLYQMGATGGTKSISFTLDPTAFGLPVGQYNVQEIIAAGTILPGPPTPPTLTLPATVVRQVPAANARVFIFTKS